MVLRRRAGEIGEEDYYYSWQDQGGRGCGQGREMPMRGRAIASVVGREHPDPCRKPLVTLKPAGPVKQQQTQQNTRSRAELRLISKYMLGARPVEEGGDEVALRKLVKSTTFKKFVQRLELENEVVELHEQLEREVELHSTLEKAVAHVSSASQLPESLLHGLPGNVQRLLTDIAMLEAIVLRLETQASALQWDIGHARTERESMEHSLHVVNHPVAPASPTRLPPGRLVPLLPKLAPAQLPRLPNVVRTESLSPANNNPKSPTLATLKELLHTSVPEAVELQQFKFCTPPKSPRGGSPNSPRPSLRSLWSALDGQPQTPILQKLNAKDRARIHQHSSPDVTTTYFPSSAAAGAVPSNVHHQPLVSSCTPGEPPRTSTTPVTPAAACQQPDSPPTRKLLNPARLLVSTKRLAFWNFSSSSVDDTASLNNRSANPTPEPELQHLSSSPPEQQHDCISILDEDFTDDVRMRKLRRSRGMKRPDQCLSSPRDSSYCSSDISSPRKSLKDSPRPSCVGIVDMWTTAELPSNANRVSEEMVRCMVDIYCNLAEPGSDSQAGYQECPLSPSSHTGRLSTSSSLSSSSYSDSSLPFGARSPDVNPGGLHGGDVVGCEATSDPYTATGRLPWANIGPYSDAYEVPWLSVGKHQLEYVAHSLGTFRLLVERLAKVEPSAMTHEQKLAFWINLYNALLMHAFLAYGIPRSDLKFFTLMQKAAYCVGGHWFNAAAIECNLLKAKIMLHRPQFALIMALHSKKLTEEQSRYGIEKPEPKVHFALSCGGRSSPMVRIYTPEHVHDELDCAFQDYLRATVGLTPKGRVLLPKLVYNYAREFADDDGVLDWVCRFLPVSHVTLVHECIHQQQQKQQRHGQRRLWTQHSSPFSVAPYSFAFRYLFPRSISTDLSHPCL